MNILTVKGLDNGDTVAYNLERTRLEELELSKLRKKEWDPRKKKDIHLSADVRNRLKEQALRHVADLNNNIEETSTNKIEGREITSDEAAIITQAAIRVISGKEPKGKEPVNENLVTLQKTVENNDLKPLSDDEIELMEYVTLPPAPKDEIVPKTFSDKLTEINDSHVTKKNMTEGKPNAFYPLLSDWKKIIKGTQQRSFEAQKLKNTLEVLYNSIIYYAQWDQEVVTLLQHAWSKSEELEQFMTSNEKTKWGPMHERLKATRKASVPLPFSSHFSKTNQSVSSHTSSQKPEDVEQRAKIVQQLEESMDVRDKNFRDTHWFDKFLQAQTEKIKIRIGEINGYLKCDSIERFETKSKTQKKSTEHVLSRNNKQGVIKNQLKFIDKVLTFKETLDVVMNALSMIETQFQTDYVDILEKYKKVFDQEHALLIEIDKLNKETVTKAVEALQKVIDEEKVDGYDTIDINSVSVLLDDPNAVKELTKGTGTRDSIRKAAITQKLILEEFLKNAETRMTKSGWLRSQGVTPLYNTFCEKLDALKKQKASSN